MGFSLHVSPIGKDRAHLMIGKEMIFPRKLRLERLDYFAMAT